MAKTTIKLDRLPFSARGESLIGQEMFKILDKAKSLELAGEKIYHLELGNPRIPPPDEIYEETIYALKNKRTGYISSSGLLELREEIARQYSLSHEREIAAEEVVISPANLLISQFMDLVCDRGDRIVFFSPVFPTYLAASSYIGLDVQDVPLNISSGFDLSVEDVDRAMSLRPRAIVVNSANNPTGRVYSQQIMEYLARKCDEQGVWLLSDETYANIAFGKPFFSLARLDYPQLVVMSSFSKIFSIPGYRVGYAIANIKVAEKLTLSNSTLFSCSPIFTQVGCLAGLKVLHDYEKKIKLQYKKTTQEIAKIMHSSSIVGFSAPDAAFYFFVDISSTSLNDFDFCELLLNQKFTAATPGSSFGKQYSNFVRIALCGNFEDVKEGVCRFMELAGECDVKNNRSMSL
jgi:aspartate/methionine/tyrosine aminotransferase